MASRYWAQPANGSFTNAANWIGGVVPNWLDDAVLDPLGVTAYTVTASANVAVNSLDTSATTTLDIATPVFRAVNGTGGGSNKGTILVEAGAALRTNGVFDNSGKINLGGKLDAANGSLTLSGGGILTEYGPSLRVAHGRILAADFDNIDNTIWGGQVGSDAGISIACTGTLTNGRDASLINRSVKGGYNLGILTSQYLNNAGLIENQGGRLTIDAVTINNSGVIDKNTSRSIYVSSDSLTNTGTINAGDRGVLWISRFENDLATITNKGTIESSGLNFMIFDSINYFSNTGFILSGGEFAGFGGDAASASIINSGVIAATGPKATLNIYVSITNTGKIEALAGATVNVYGAISNSGRLIVDGGTMLLQYSPNGPGLVTIDGGALDVRAATAAHIVFLAPSGLLELEQSAGFTGGVFGFSNTGATSLDLRDITFVGGSQTTYRGSVRGGVLTVSDNTHAAHIRLAGDFTQSSFLASSDGHGGTTIVATPSPGSFVQAAAAMSASQSAMTGGPLFGRAASALLTPTLAHSG